MHQPYQRCRLNERSVVASGAFKYRYIHGHCPVVCALHENKLIKCDVLLLNYFRNAQYFSLSFVDQKSPQFDYKHLPFIIQDLQQRKMTREWLKVSKGKSIQQNIAVSCTTHTHAHTHTHTQTNHAHTHTHTHTHTHYIPSI